MFTQKFTSILCALTVPLCLLSSGCSEQPPASLTTASGDTAPNFSGPHSELFREVWEKLPEPRVHAILSDEAISDLEWTEVKQAFTQCISENGMSVREITLGGGISVSYLKTPPESGEVAIHECQQSSGLTGIGLLHKEQLTNPDNEDIAVLMSKCMVRAQVVQPDFSAEDWRRENENPKPGPEFGYDYLVSQQSGDAAANACVEDPTHAFQQ